MLSCNKKLDNNNSVLTCIHVLNKTAKYEYIQEDKKNNCVESFTCSECLDKQDKNNLRCVCKNCFIESRIGVC